MGGVVLSPITHQAMLEWSSTQGIELTPWEIDGISRVDDLYLAAQRKHMAASRGSKGK